MEKVNEIKDFNRRIAPSWDYKIYDLKTPIVHPYRLEYRVPKTNTDEFSSYLSLVLVPTLGISNHRIEVTKLGAKYDNYHITLNAKVDDMELINTFLTRLCRGIEDYSVGRM